MPDLAEGGASIPRPVTWGWALKRAALGILILAVGMGGVAWLTYASIEPDPGTVDQAKTIKVPRSAGQAEVRL